MFKLKNLWNKVKSIFKKGNAPKVNAIVYKSETIDKDELLTSQNGIEFICSWEGFSATPYKCSAGVWTKGYGTIKNLDGSPVSRNDKAITKNEALELMAYEINEKENVLDYICKEHGVFLKQHQFDAMVSFMYNLGSDSVVNREWTSARNLQDNKLMDLADCLWMYRKASGKIIKGLVKRRASEKELFINGIYGRS